MPKITVIIPVYNAERTLENCLQSVINQTLENIEIICVNDGSQDNSQKILELYAAKDSRIKIINQKNQGAGTARNAGIEAALGEYIHFLDSDDYLKPKAYEIACQVVQAEGADICMFNYYINDKMRDNEYAVNVFHKYPAITKLSPVRMAGNERLFCYSSVVPWNKIYKTEFLKESNIRFSKLTCAEDRLFYYQVLAANPLIACLGNPLVVYNVNHGQKCLSRICDDTGFECHLHSFEAILEHYSHFPHALHNILIDVCMADLNFLYLNKNAILSDEMKSKIIKFCEKYSISDKNFLTCSWQGFYRLVHNQLPMIPVVFAANENYVPYMGVAIKSLLQNSSREHYYDIHIFYDNLTNESQNLLGEICAEYPNAGLTFVNVNDHIDNKKLYSRAYFSKEMYYRILIPELLCKYDKVIYLDCDLLVVNDISLLYAVDMKDNLVAAVVDYLDDNMKSYVQSILKNTDEYFNSGVMIFNTKTCNEMGLKEKCLAKLNSSKVKYCCPDQDILNIICNGRVKYLDMHWNFRWQFLLPYLREIINFTLKQKEDYEQAGLNPSIIHYTSGKKPWNFSCLQMSKIWWKYAAQTPFYEEIIFRNHQNHQNDDKLILNKVCDILQLGKLKRRYWRYKVLSKICFGNLRKKYKNKRKTLKQRIEEIKGFINNR